MPGITSPLLFGKFQELCPQEDQNPQMTDYAGTSFTNIIYTKSATFPSSRISLFLSGGLYNCTGHRYSPQLSRPTTVRLPFDIRIPAVPPSSEPGKCPPLPKGYVDLERTTLQEKTSARLFLSCVPPPKLAECTQRSTRDEAARNRSMPCVDRTQTKAQWERRISETLAELREARRELFWKG